MNDPGGIDATVELKYKREGANGRVVLTVYAPGAEPMTDRLDVTSANARAKFADRYCEKRPGINQDAILTELDRIAAEVAGDFGRKPTKEPERRPSREELLAQRDAQTLAALDETPPEVRSDAEKMLDQPTLIDLVLADIAALGVVGERELGVMSFLVGTSRLLEKPLSAITQGLSSTGKSFVADRVSLLFPDETVLRATDITQNALYYMPLGRLMHTFVAAGERPRAQEDDRAEATRALREMIGSGELRKVVTIKGDRGPPRAEEIWQPGPIAYMESTTLAKIFDEDANRFLPLGTDESEEQTARIVLAQAAAARGVRVDPRPVIQRHHTLQRLLQRAEVLIPYSEAIAEAIPKGRNEARRAMPHMLSAIRAGALLHQRQRAGRILEHGEVISATLDDYVIARALLMGPLGRALGGALPGAVARFGERVRARHGVDPFTSTEVFQADEVLNSKGKVNEYLKELEGAGVIECLEPNKGPKPAIWRVVGKVPVAGAIWLPTVDDLRSRTS